MADAFLPPLDDDWEPTRATLHAYALAVDAIPRAHGVAHPKWWHISLAVTPTGLRTDTVPLPGGGVAGLHMDLRSHEVVLESSRGDREGLSMTDGATGTELADAVISSATRLGLEGDYDRGKFQNDDAREYDPATAERFLEALVDVDTVFRRHANGLGARVGPVQLWPHGFDLAVEWFGTKVVQDEEDGETAGSPAQLNLGFYPKPPAYFYSNPWPLDRSLLGTPLPHGAHWETEQFEGTILPYAHLAGDPEAGRKLLEYASAVYDVAAPTLRDGNGGEADPTK